MKAIQTMFARSNAARAGAIVLLALTCAGLPVRGSDANPPRGMTYQGYLTDGSGVPLGHAVPANYDIIFRIYDASTDGVLKWAEKQTVTIDTGQFSVVLGEGANNGSEPRGSLDTVFTAPDASDRFIDITVKISGSDVNIAPRLRLVTSPYAFAATTASKIVGADGATLLTSTSANTLTLNGTLNATAGVIGLTAAQVPNLDATKITTGTLTRPLVVPGNGVIEFGFGIAGKESNAGKIGYGAFDGPGNLDIVGAGTTAANRAIKLWAEGGVELTGPLRSSGGNARGVGAVDLQFSRAANDQVASGDYSALIGGSGNRNAGPQSTIAGGNGHVITANGAASFIATGVSSLVDAPFGFVSGSRCYIGPAASHSFVGGYRSRATMYSQFVWSDATTDDDFAPQTPNSFNVRCRGNAYFTGGSVVGSFVSSSDRNIKTNFQSIQPRDVLAKLVAMPIQRWSYTNAPTVVHMGAIAQDFSAAYGLGSDDKGITTVDADGVAMASIQGLHEIVMEQKAEIEKLKGVVTDLQTIAGKANALENEVSGLKKQLAANQEAFQELNAAVRKLAAAQKGGPIVASKTVR